jgi:hypothetical protein
MGEPKNRLMTVPCQCGCHHLITGEWRDVFHELWSTTPNLDYIRQMAAKLRFMADNFTPEANHPARPVRPPMVPPYIVGIDEIAQLLGVRQQTAAIWRSRNLLPSEDGTVAGGPVWKWATIESWAMRTGRRLYVPDSLEQARQAE